MLEIIVALTFVCLLTNSIGLGMGVRLLADLPQEVREIPAARMLNIYTIWQDRHAQLLWIIITFTLVNACYLLLIAYNMQWIMWGYQAGKEFLDSFTELLNHTLLIRTIACSLVGLGSFWVQWYIYNERKLKQAGGRNG